MENAISINGITKSFGEKKVLDDINLDIKKGEILGLLGPSGAGKTTLINTILGLYKPNEGSITVAGYDRVTEAVNAKKNMAFITDECLFPLDLSPKDIGKTFGPLYDGFKYKKFEEYCKRFGVPMKKSGKTYNII